MKKNFMYVGIPLFAIGIFCSLLSSKVLNIYNEDTIARPILNEQEQEKQDPNKSRSWTAEEAQANAANLELVQQSIAAGKSLLAKNADAFTDVTRLGTWKSRGPYNMPGTFQFCEVDEGTDDVYAVTQGNYGQIQFIWKGTLTGTNWTLINPKHPSRYEDMIAVANGSSRRIIAAHERGRIMYSDNAGQTWTYTTGAPSGLFSTIMNRQDNNVIYTTDGKIVYKSTDKGTTFTTFYTIGTANVRNARLYTPRWNIQPNAADVYLAVDNKFYKMNAAKTSFDLINSNLPTGSGPLNDRIFIGGDSRKLWLINGINWSYSTNGGVNFTHQSTKDWYYNTESEGMYVYHTGGVSPIDPNIVIGGSTFPLSTRNGFATQNNDAKNTWGWYQNSVGNDEKVRTNFHPDMHGSQFFYDKTGKLLTLRSTDGGVFRSDTEWEKTSYPNGTTGVFYNITLFGVPTQEAYDGAFMVGKNNVNDFTTGTQDQGEQSTRVSTYNEPMISWDQTPGGDGRPMITGDGLIGWLINGGGKTYTRVNLYSGTVYKGNKGTASADVDVFGGSDYTNAVGDWSNGNRIWTLGSALRRIEYNTGTQAITGKEDPLAGSGRIQGLAQSRTNAAVLYAMRSGIVYKTTNNGTNWSQLAPQTATGITAGNTGMGWNSPANDQVILFATQSGSAVKTVLSKNGGSTWINVTGSGANLFPSTTIGGMAGTADGKLVFASTGVGPYVFIVSEEKWYPLAIDPKVPIFNGKVMYCQKFNGKEYARFSTWGQGIWDFEISTTTLGIEDNIKDDITLKVFPNPTSDLINITLSENLNDKAEITIYNQRGQNVYNKVKQFDSQISIDMSAVSDGIYFCKVKSGSFEKTQKVIVKH
jgi:Secretion system C-terminal sorting domain